ncbi:1616_t:CDS:2 [Cetraspora pellucida]|uniref:1616_t:CDS:1 n=1 Tax=Cetraspora pellucida TaxID=1433469 RepID=A0A9N9BB94_9GLOM|nr:1616_t:CDS:2 [Cetraspora pellucida]
MSSKNTAGRLPKEVWKYIQKGNLKVRGHYSQFDCIAAGSDVEQKFLRIVSARNHPRENETESDFLVFKKVHTNEPQESYYQSEIFSS